MLHIESVSCVVEEALCLQLKKKTRFSPSSSQLDPAVRHALRRVFFSSLPRLHQFVEVYQQQQQQQRLGELTDAKSSSRPSSSFGPLPPPPPPLGSTYDAFIPPAPDQPNVHAQHSTKKEKKMAKKKGGRGGKHRYRLLLLLLSFFLLRLFSSFSEALSWALSPATTI